MSQSNCIFCKVVAGSIPSVKIFEDDQTITFLDIAPVSVGHALVISKEHHRDLMSISPEQLIAVTLTSQKIARAQMTALQPAGIRVAQFNGEVAGQTVFHYHVHLRPAYEDHDARRSHGQHQVDLDELEPIANRIRNALSYA